MWSIPREEYQNGYSDLLQAGEKETLIPMVVIQGVQESFAESSIWVESKWVSRILIGVDRGFMRESAL